LKSPLLLVILDGWGLSPEPRGNAIRLVRTPNFTKLQQSYPYTVLQASGERVGLPEGQMGNSEVGHLNMGAGRVVYQDITRISMAIKTGEFCKNPVLIDMMQEVKEKGTSLHLFGLLSDGGVHSHLTHLYAILEMARRFKLGKVYIHAFNTATNASYNFTNCSTNTLANKCYHSSTTSSSEFLTTNSSSPSKLGGKSAPSQRYLVPPAFCRILANVKI
jgi:bisphosphoglycerate-independent phosphoglycerate mutase